MTLINVMLKDLHINLHVSERNVLLKVIYLNHINLRI